PALDKDFEADLCWLDQQALNPARLYWLKQGTRLTQVRVQAVRTRRDIHELRSVDWNGTLAMNDIGRVQLRARDPLVLDDYDAQRATGAFILIDTATNQTAAAGLIRRGRAPRWADRAFRDRMARGGRCPARRHEAVCSDSLTRTSESPRWPRSRRSSPPPGWGRWARPPKNAGYPPPRPARASVRPKPACTARH